MIFTFLFGTDKIYEARHKLLNLYPEPVVQAKIPPQYFSLTEQDFNTSALVEILSSVPNSPLTPCGVLQNFAPTFPNDIGSRPHDFLNLTPANLRYHAMQQQSLQQSKNQNMISNYVSNDMQTFSNTSPRSMNANTSGYLSQLSQMGSFNTTGSSNSLEHSNGNATSNFHQQENQIVLGTPSRDVSRHFNENDSHSFEIDNHLLTPIYHSVST